LTQLHNGHAILISTQRSDTVLKLLATNVLRAAACWTCLHVPLTASAPLSSQQQSFLPATIPILLYRQCQGWPSWHLGTLAQLLQPPTASSVRSPERQRKTYRAQVHMCKSAQNLCTVLYGLPFMLGQLGLTIVPHTMPHTQAADSNQQTQLLLCSLWYDALLLCLWRRPALAQGLVGVTSECSRLCVLYSCPTGRKCVVTDRSLLCTAAPGLDWGLGFMRRPKRSRM
jgi:hypothetical protein